MIFSLKIETGSQKEKKSFSERKRQRTSFILEGVKKNIFEEVTVKPNDKEFDDLDR